MRSRAVAVLLAGCAAAVLGLVVAAAADERELAFTLGVRSTKPAVVIPAGGTGCQNGIPVPASFAAVELMIGTYFRPGPPVRLSVREAGTERRIGAGSVPGGYPDNHRHRVQVGVVPEGGRVDVCVRNQGARRIAIYGGESDYSLTSDATLDGEPATDDMDLSFIRAEPESMLALVPVAFERAALWQPAGVTVFWLLSALMLVLVPALLARALLTARD